MAKRRKGPDGSDTVLLHGYPGELFFFGLENWKTVVVRVCFVCLGNSFEYIGDNLGRLNGGVR
jgi:hypothetical protein